MDENQSYTGINFTNLFKRELFLYSLGDIRFKKPIAIKRVLYTLLFIVIWTLPIFLLTGFQFNLIWVSIAFGPPIALGYYSTRPAFGGKTLFDFVKAIAIFITEPKGWTDSKGTNYITNDKYFIENEIWISRRRELEELNDLYNGEKIELSDDYIEDDGYEFHPDEKIIPFDGSDVMFLGDYIISNRCYNCGRPLKDLENEGVDIYIMKNGTKICKTCIIEMQKG